MNYERTHTPIRIEVDGITTYEEAIRWLANQSKDVQETTYFEDEGLFQKPMVEEGAFVDETAKLIGGMIIRSGCYVGPYAVVRLDEQQSIEPLVIGEDSNLQDGSIVHSTTSEIGKRVIVAHQAIVHGAVIEDDVTLYIQAVVDGNGTVVGKGSFLHRGAYVGKGLKIPPKRFIAPGRNILTQAEADDLPEVTSEIVALREHVLELNEGHVKRYLRESK